MSMPNVRSLRWLQTQLELDPHLYPGSAALGRAVASLIEQMPNDDSCAPLGSFGGRRLFYNGKKLTLVPLLYRLCTPEQPDIPTTRMQRLCQCASECANPRHWLPVTLFKQRERELQRNQFGNTRLTEAILSAYHPADALKRHSTPKRRIYKRLHVYVRMDDRTFAHIAPVRARSKLVGVYRLPLAVDDDTDSSPSTPQLESPNDRASATTVGDYGESPREAQAAECRSCAGAWARSGAMTFAEMLSQADKSNEHPPEPRRGASVRSTQLPPVGASSPYTEMPKLTMATCLRIRKGAIGTVPSRPVLASDLFAQRH